MMNFEVKAHELKKKVRRTIENHFTEKSVDSWVQANILTNGVLSGSAISSIYHDEKPKDYDIYFKEWEIIDAVKDVFKTSLPLQKLIVDWNDYAGNTDIPLINGKCFTKRAITLEHDIQYIIMGTLNECRPTFDFIHCMPYYDFAEDKFYISERQLQSIADKMLVFNPLREKPATQARIEKFQKRGWGLDIRKSIVPKIDLTKHAVLVTMDA